MTFLDILLVARLCTVFGAGYVILGFIVGATLCKRSRASWRWVDSNLGEFIMSMSRLGLLFYALAWPIILLFGSISAFFRWAMRKTESYNPIDWHLVTRKFEEDIEFNSMYPEVMKVHIPEDTDKPKD